MLQWFNLSDPAPEESLHDIPLFREFAGLDDWTTRLPDETTIPRFRPCWTNTSSLPRSWHGVDADSGLVHTVHDTPETNGLLHGQEVDASAMRATSAHTGVRFSMCQVWLRVS